MKYVFDGNYAQFRGYVFSHGKPTEITDVGTLEEIKRHPAFKPFVEVCINTHSEPVPFPFETKPDPKACPKCGRVIGRGRYFHVKYCGTKK